MKRKCLSLLLCVLISLSLCMPALAADESMEDELTRVTLAVKNALSIGDKYTVFTGDIDDMGALRYWTLRWSDENGDSIQVLAAESGKVLQYRANSSEFMRSYSGSYAPSFSKVTAAQANSSAKAFLTSVLTGGESAELTNSAGSISVSLNDSDYSISAQILMNGVPLPYSANLQVSSETGDVIYFSRGDCYEAYENNVPSPCPQYLPHRRRMHCRTPSDWSFNMSCRTTAAVPPLFCAMCRQRGMITMWMRRPASWLT